ncbi:MAG: PAS domain-containing protein [Clostridia bacterium]|nr:PAS domain-containing protein [Clostridia bacterium]
MTGKIFRYVFIMGILVMLLCSLLFVGLQYSQTKEQTYSVLKQEAFYAANGVQLAGENYLETLDSQTRITWIASDGTVLFDSEFGPHIANQSGYTEVVDAMETGEGHGIRKSETSGSETMYYAVKCADGTVLRLSRPLAAVWSVVLTVSPVLWVTILVLVLAGIFAFRAAKQITKPINAIEIDDLAHAKVYPELAPLVKRIREQNLTIGDQIDELTRRQKEFSVLTENMNEGFVLTDKNGVVLSANSGAQRALAGCDIGESLPESEDARIADAINKALAGERAEYFFENREKCFQIIANPVIYGGKPIGTVVLAVDVTETIRREQLRREFSANVSHELKTPLTSISGFAELMIQDLVPPEKAREFAGDIYRESVRLISLINDIIELSRLDEQTVLPEKEEVDLFAVAEDVLDGLTSAAEKKGVALSLAGESAKIQGIPNYIDEIVYNLCDNAVKYNRQGGQVTVTVTKGEKTADLCVKDTGIGIPSEYRDRIFERFYRVDSARSNDSPGTGLGLSIVKHAAALHNAQIELESEPGVGTEITVRFPI